MKRLLKNISFNIDANLIVENVIQIKSEITISVDVIFINPIKHHVCKKNIFLNSSRSACEIDEYLKL